MQARSSEKLSAKRQAHRAIWMTILTLGAWLFALYSLSWASTVTLSWDANSESDLAGYKVYWGCTSSRQYATNQDVGNQTSVLVDIPDPAAGAPDKTCFFAVTAYDTASPPNESGFSNEVTKVVIAPPPPPDTTAPAAPSGLRVVEDSTPPPSPEPEPEPQPEPDPPPPPSGAGILFSDDFASQSVTDQKWGTFKDPSNFGVRNGVLEMRYAPGKPNGPGFETVEDLGIHPTEAYFQWDERYSSGWTWSGIAQKIIFVNRTGVGTTKGLMIATAWGGDQPTINTENFADGFEVDQNVGSKGLAGGDWHRICLRVKAGSNGALEMWIDGTRVMLHTGLPMEFDGIYGFTLSSYYNAGGDTPNGVQQTQTRWVDNFVVSTNGCGF